MATSDPPTFYRDIKPLFSQWDRIQMIGRFDLWSYADVKSRANSIWLALQEDPAKPNTGWSLLPFVHIMPEVNGPLPQADIDLFKAWIDAGCIEGDHPPTPASPGRLRQSMLDASADVSSPPNPMTRTFAGVSR